MCVSMTLYQEVVGEISWKVINIYPEIYYYSRYFKSNSRHCPSCFSLVDNTGCIVKKGGK